MWSGDNTFRAWLKKEKSDCARTKWLQSTTARFFTLDFNSQTFYYSHSEAAKDVSGLVYFKDILEVEELPASPQHGKKAQAGGFRLKTRRRSYELYTMADRDARTWVQALNLAKDFCQAPNAWDDETCRDFLKRVPCEARSAAASMYPEWKWKAMTWIERVVAVQGYYCDDITELLQFVHERSAAAHQASTPSRQQRGQPPTMTGAGGRLGGDHVLPADGRREGARLAQLPEVGVGHADDASRSLRLRTPGSWTSEPTQGGAGFTAEALRQHDSLCDPAAPGARDAEALRQRDALCNQAALGARAAEALRQRDALCGPAAPGACVAEAGGQIAQRHSPAQQRQLPCGGGFAAEALRQHDGPSRPAAPGTGVAEVTGGHILQRRDATGQYSDDAELERLRTIFDTNDSLQVLFSHHLDTLVDSVIRAMHLRGVPSGEMVVRQGWESNTMYIVDEGAFDVWKQQEQGHSKKVCQYGPGQVFGQMALLNNEKRPATVIAATPARVGSRRPLDALDLELGLVADSAPSAPSSSSRCCWRGSGVWALERDCFQNLLKAPDGTKTIGLLGGVMLLINNLAGPTIVSMPALAQEAGWLAILLVQAVVAAFATACGYMLIDAMSKMPGNKNFEQRIEFTNLAMFYLPRPAYVLVMLCYHVNSILSLMSLIIQSGQVMDYVMLNLHGCAPGLSLGPDLGYVCGTRTDSVTPFGDSTVISSSMVVVALVCAPFAVKNLDDNVVLQYIAIAGLCVMSVVWVCLLAAEPDFPRPLPTMTWSQGPLIGTVLFNFAFTSTLPSWVNEKRPDVSVAASFGITMVYVVLTYTVVGVVGGMAYKPFYMTDENLFSKINAGGSRLGVATVTAYPMLQNFTSIPVFSILIRYNLLQSGLSASMATLIAVGLPWALSVPFYTGSGFDTISEWGGLVTSSVINFIVPAVLYFLARGQQGHAKPS